MPPSKVLGIRTSAKKKKIEECSLCYHVLPNFPFTFGSLFICKMSSLHPNSVEVLAHSILVVV